MFKSTTVYCQCIRIYNLLVIPVLWSIIYVRLRTQMCTSPRQNPWILSPSPCAPYLSSTFFDSTWPTLGFFIHKFAGYIYIYNNEYEYMCMYVCMYIDIYIYVCIYKYMYMYIYMYWYMNTDTYIYIYV